MIAENGYYLLAKETNQLLEDCAHAGIADSVHSAQNGKRFTVDLGPVMKTRNHFMRNRKVAPLLGSIDDEPEQVADRNDRRSYISKAEIVRKAFGSKTCR